jgi:RimJ/RimL family protein N-acetyltransferase
MSELFPAEIETDRLRLEAATTETVDVFDLYEICREGAPHVEVMTEYLTWDPHETPKATREFLEAVTDQRESGETATYVIRPRASEDGAGEIAGMTGLDVDWDARTAEFGVWLRKRFRGRGYSGERAGALMTVAFDRLDLDAVVVTVQSGNEKSRTAVSRYVEAHGGHHEGLLRNALVAQDGTPVDVHRYSVTREEYDAAANG